MTDEQRARFKLAREALAGVGPEGLRQAAAVAPKPAADVLRAVADALESPDPDAALQAAMGEAGAAQAAVQDGLAALERFAQGLVGRTQDELGKLRTTAEGMEAERQRLAREAAGLEGDAVGGEVGDVLKRAAALVRDDKAFAPVLAVLGEAEGLAGLAERVVAQARRDPKAAEAATGQLAARVKALEARLGEVEATLPRWQEADRLVAELQAIAAGQGRSEAAELAFLRAGWAEASRGLRDPGVQAGWRDAFDACVRFGLLPLARVAGQRVQAVAMDKGDLKSVAVVAHRVADLAVAAGDARTEVLARLEEALVLTRLAGHAEDAKKLARDAVERAAAADGPTQARALLSYGQVLAATGDAAGAREAWRRLMRTHGADRACVDEIGRAALELGRSQVAAGQDRQAAQNLQLAYDIAKARRDGMLYGPALAHLTELARLEGDEARVQALLAEARVWLPQLVGPDAVPAFERAVAAAR